MDWVVVNFFPVHRLISSPVHLFTCLPDTHINLNKIHLYEKKNRCRKLENE